MRRADQSYLLKRQSFRHWVELVFNVGIICIGLLFLGPGTYVSFFSPFPFAFIFLVRGADWLRAF